MVPYFGDFAEDATVYIPFNTFSSDDPAASVTITNLADADIKVHKDASTTQIVTDGATVAIDFDGITGNHVITIDTSAHADYATGSDYIVRIEGTTVDGGTINAFVGSFSIENRFMRGTDSANTTTPPTAAAIVNEWETQSQADPTGFHVNVKEVNGTAQTANDNGADLNTLLTRIAQTLNLTASGNIGIDWANVENPSTAVDLSQTDIQLCDTVTTNSDMRGTDGANTTTPPTAAANADAVWDEATAGHTSAGTYGKAVGDGVTAWVTATGFSTHNAADVWTSGTRTLTSFGFSVDLNADQSGVTIGTANAVNVTQVNSNTNAATRLALSAAQIIPGTVDTATNGHTPTTTVFQADDITEATADHYNGRIVMFTSGVLAGQATSISDYEAVGGIGQFTVVAMTEAPSNNDTFIIV